MLGGLFNGEENKSAAGRLREMIVVLRRHEVVSGMTPVKLREIFEDLGPTFVKLGQIMSMRPDFVPLEYCDELMKLQNSAKPLDFDIVIGIIEAEYQRPWQEVFRSINPVPLGSASIAQVHEGVLLPGEHVVIKVQRPDIYKILWTDLVLIKRAVTMMRFFSKAEDIVDFRSLMDDLWNIAQEEMNFLVEANHLEEFAHLNRADGYVVCPRVYRELSTERLLVMEYAEGIPLEDAAAIDAENINMTLVCRRMGENYAKQIITDGFFHADPHPGNVRVRGTTIVWLDLGMMGRLSSRELYALRRVLISVGSKDVFELKLAALSLGIVKGQLNHAALYQDIETMMERYSSLDFSDVQVGVVANQILKIMRRHRIACPSGLAMFARGVMTMEALLRRYAPEVSFLDIFARSLSLEMTKDVNFKTSINKAKREGIRFFQKSIHIPEQMSDILKMTMSGQTKLNIELMGSEEPIQRIDKMSNKMIIALLCAALLVSSSTICTTNMEPQIVHIPVLGIIGYLIAFILSLKLIWDIHKGV